MAISCGIDFHPRQQPVCYCNADDGELTRSSSHIHFCGKLLFTALYYLNGTLLYTRYR
jgi:hypothetical protein